MTMADIAGRMEQRVQAQRQTNGEKLDAAQKVDWSKFKLPSAANVTSLRYSAAKDNPDRVWLSGKVNGIECVSLLSVNESTAVKNRLATLEQVAAANRDFHKKALDIVGPGQKQEVNAKEDAAVKAIVDRASDSTARNFSPEQLKTLNDFAAGAETPDKRAKVFDGGCWCERCLAEGCPQRTEGSRRGYRPFRGSGIKAIVSCRRRCLITAATSSD